MLGVAGNVMPFEEPEDQVEEVFGVVMTRSPLDGTTHINVIMTDKGEIIATSKLDIAGEVTTLPGILDVTSTASMKVLNDNVTEATVTESDADSNTTEHSVTYVTVTGETGTFTGVPMTMTTDVFALSFSGTESPAAKAARTEDATSVYTTPSLTKTTDDEVTTSWYEATTAYWYGDTPDVDPEEEELMCCENAQGVYMLKDTKLISDEA